MRALATEVGRGPAVLSVASEDGRAAPVVELDDTELVERVRAGDVEAYDLLVVRHMKRAYSVAYRLLGQREDAEDLVQDAFLAALEKIDTFKQGRSFAPWFYRILVNRGLNSRKSRSLRRMDALPPEISDASRSPLRDTERAELKERLAEVLRTLPPRQKSIVELFELEGFSSLEIAEILGLSDGTVRWHLHQARAKLREALGPFVRSNREA
ncbi:MAG TPA: sigma-70 family RNA polymerase sigma factor [Longimicrobiaceae bacterium]